MPDMTVLLISLVAVFVIFALIIIIGCSNYRIAKRAKFKITSMFPYELQNYWNMPYTTYIRFLAGLFAVSYSLFGLCAFFSCDVAISKILIVTLILSAFMMMIIIYVNMNVVKIHLSLAVVLFVLCLLNYGIMTILLLGGQPFYLPNWLGYITLAISIFYLGSLFNPKLYKWMMLEKKESEEGMTILSRPKYFVLPIYEWVTIALNLLIIVLITIGYLV